MSEVRVNKDNLLAITEYLYDDERMDYVERIENGSDDSFADGAFYENIGFEDISDEGVDRLTAYIQEVVGDDPDDLVDWLAYNTNSGHVFAITKQVMVEAGISTKPKLSKEFTRKLREIAYE